MSRCRPCPVCCRCSIAAGEVADTRPLHLDDAGAEIGELACREGCRDRMLQRDDCDSGQRSHGRRPHLIVAVASMASQPSWSFAHRWKVLPSASGPPHTEKGLMSKSGRTALKRY